MTQKDLAEKLNVSDKAVSRWERDENASDLSLIPVIAELFEVTADELLRGEKLNNDKVANTENDGEQKSSPKVEKQIKYIINDSKNKFEIRSTFSVALVVVGFILALLINFAFYRALVGFYVATIVYVVAIFCEIAFYKMCDNSLNASEFDGAKIDECRVGIIMFLEKVISLIIVVCAFTIPLCSISVNSFDGDSYVCIDMGSWITVGISYVIIATIICVLTTALINKYLLKIDRNAISSFKMLISKTDKKLLAKLATILVLILFPPRYA